MAHRDTRQFSHRSPGTSKNSCIGGGTTAYISRSFGFADSEHEEARLEEAGRSRTRERVRLWYVALTRARDLLLLPRQ